jgi:hypothetical protein
MSTWFTPQLSPLNIVRIDLLSVEMSALGSGDLAGVVRRSSTPGMQARCPLGDRS